MADGHQCENRKLAIRNRSTYWDEILQTCRLRVQNIRIVKICTFLEVKNNEKPPCCKRIIIFKNSKYEYKKTSQFTKPCKDESQN